jgi:Glu-tRNA(Gln) amidotransferase subunit E-like FAD-binding protein
MGEKKPIREIARKQHPVASELGDVDIATQYESMRDRTFHYQAFRGETCLVETDSEPPHELNRNALEIALQIALLLNCKPVEEIHVMRKTITDGSNTSAFQRTMVVALNGTIEYKGKKIPVTHVSLEEDAAAIVDEKDGNVTYRLNRLGVPLVEIATGILENYGPEEVQDIAFQIGLICRSTRVKRGVGTIRQDVNVSIKKGARVEIKGVQELGLLSKVIEGEVARQLEMIHAKKKVEEETRAANLGGTTRFTRPLPGAGRLYPETDIKPLSVTKEMINKIGKGLPEPLTKKLIGFKKIGLSDDLSKQLVRSEYLEIFESIVKNKKLEPSVVAATFVNTLKDLRREGVKVENLTEQDFVKIFDYLASKKIVKEALPEIIKYLANHPGNSIDRAIEALNLTPLKFEELKKIIKEVIAQPGMDKNKAVGIVMSKVRGKVDAQLVIETVKKMLG